MKSSPDQLAFWDEPGATEPTVKALKWKAFVTQNYRVLKRWPAATPIESELELCPQHDEAIGPVTRMCLSCHHEAWAELGRLYHAANGGRERKQELGESEVAP